MLSPLFVLPFFIKVARAVSDNTTLTASGCPTPDATACNRRSVWSLLASCGLTLLVCVWHVVHLAVPLPYFKWYHTVLYRLVLMIITFFTPELMIETAFLEWFEASRMTKHVRDVRGYEWWTMTHSHFALNGGFALCDNTSTRELRITKTSEVRELLDLIDEGEIANSVVTEDDIQDKSTSDALGKAILIVQLSWFTTQVIVRLVYHLTVTLVELDTVCMSLLTLALIFCWWKKPCCPGRPYIFIKRDAKPDDGIEMSPMVEGSKKLRNPQEIETQRSRWRLLFPAEPRNSGLEILLPVCLTWATFGALHAIAWNYDFPSGLEKVTWCVSSLVLAGSPIFFVAGAWFGSSPSNVVHQRVGELLWMATALVGVVSRLSLVVLMLASLRSLPPSSYEVIPWTNYIPHL